MTLTSRQAAMWIGTMFGGLGGLAVVGMAAAFWISLEVKSQITPHPDTTLITQDIAVIRSTVTANGSKADVALANQQRFEEIFMEYLQNEANR